MDKNINKQSIDSNLDIVTANGLAEELALILNDFFCGEFSVDKGRIVMQMNNGQNFRLSISEVDSTK